ncbi:DDE-type integrase/transposase/recombinase [Yersinia wautersii]|uniref:Transposase remnant n=1 Tax=Yersinia wautersii TaxID=1341643 RepID=A0ABM9TGR2_9GAMM|nr:DDE-type integrase/transposase/recombinase [Yersinia wautersii]CRG51133.1 putative transposase remnant [Yersinia wautersii]
MSLIRNAFKRLHYPINVIAQCVRGYLAYALSLRNLEEMMTERGIIVDHSTLHRWVIRLVQLLDKAFRRHKRSMGVDGEWMDLHQNQRPVVIDKLVEQDHQNIKRRMRLMRGFKSFRQVKTLLAGIELNHMIRKGQRHHPVSDGLTLAEQFYLLAA